MDHEDLQAIKHIDNQYKYTVFGYLREKKKQLSLNINTIPNSISYLSLLYYYQGEYFARCSKNISISDNKMTASRYHGGTIWNNATICSKSIDSMTDCIAKWTFKINYICPNEPSFVTHFIFSLLSNPNEFERSKQKKSPYYDLFANGMKYRHDVIPKDYPQKQWQNAKNDKIALTLNLKERTFTLIKNDDDKFQSSLPKIQRRAGLEYTLCIEMFDQLYSITLTNFECTQSPKKKENNFQCMIIT